MIEDLRAEQKGNWQPPYFLAQIHLERGNVDTARTLLQETIKQAPEEEEQTLLKQVQRGEFGRCLQAFPMGNSSRSDDGQFALSGGILREVATGRCLYALFGSLSGDGRFVLSGDPDGIVRLRETTTGDCLQFWRVGHSPPPTNCAGTLWNS